MDKPNLGYALGADLKDKKNVRVTLKPNKEDELSQIEFQSNESKPWVMRIVEGPQIIFNREAYPDWKPDDFAQAVFKTLGTISIMKNALKNLWKEEEK